MPESQGPTDHREAIQRAEDVRAPAAPPPAPILREAIRTPVADSAPGQPLVPAEQSGIPYLRPESRPASTDVQRVNRSLVGQTIRERRGFMFGAALWTLLGMALIAIAAITANVHVALAAVGPVVVAMMLVLLRRRPFVCHIHEDELVFDRLDLTLPQSGVEEIMPGSHKREAFIIGHADGFVSVPAALNVPWQAFREFLRDNLEPQVHSPRLSSRLKKYHDRNVALYGLRAIKVFWARDRLRPTHPSGRSGLAVCLGFVVAGAFWLTVGISQGRGYEGWLGAGFLGLIFGFLIGVLFFMRGLQATPRLKNWERSALVLSPGGLALEQGELVGELRWGEVKKVINRIRGASFTLDNRVTQPCVRLDVPGASIMIFDLYQRPLAHIHDEIHTYWQEAVR